MMGRAGQGPNYRPQQEERNITATGDGSLQILNVFLNQLDTCGSFIQLLAAAVAVLTVPMN